jgi:hypothetical protein
MVPLLVSNVNFHIKQALARPNYIRENSSLKREGILHMLLKSEKIRRKTIATCWALKSRKSPNRVPSSMWKTFYRNLTKVEGTLLFSFFFSPLPKRKGTLHTFCKIRETKNKNFCQGRHFQI